jgi:PAS domain S-box-containing protein
LVQYFGFLYDITDQIKSEKALRKSENFFKLVAENSPDVLFIQDCNLTYTFIINPAPPLTPEDVIGKSDWDLLPPEDAKAITELKKKIIETGEPIRQEICVSPVGITRWYDVIYQPIFESDGQKAGIVSYSRDITERKLSESEILKQSLAIEQSPVSVIITNLTGNIEFVNTKFVELTGYSNNEVAGKNPNILQSGKMPKEVYKKLWDTILSGNTWRGEFHNKKKNGELYWEFASISPIIDEAGKITHFLAVKEDITLRKRVEEELLKKDQLLSSILETQQELIARYLPDTTLTFVNKSYCNLFGHSENVLIGQKFLRFIPESEWNTELSRLEQLNKRNPSNTSISQAIKPDGSLCSIEWTDLAIFNDSDEVVEIQSVGHDITEKLKAEQELIKAKEKAEENDKLKSAFINNISHEIRTPLNGILGFAPFIIQSDITMEEKEEFLEILNFNSDRLMSTMTDYMDMAMIVSGTMEVHKKEFQLQPLFEEVIEKTKQLCAEKNIELETDVPTELVDLILDSDREFIIKILNILLGNALKFTEKGKIRCGCKVNNGFLEFFVQDTGIGIARENLEMIFNMFTQEDTSLTRGYEGSGLGLSIASGLVDLLGGTISVSSEKGEGSIFTFTVPYKETDVGVISAPMKGKNAIGPGQPLVLIAEDDESNYLFMKKVLKQAGCDHLMAKNGFEAVELCKQHGNITLVLMDIKMPVMNGLEATKLIREFRPELPIIATTAYAHTGDEQRFLAAGCNGYLAKPIKKEKLLLLLQKLIKT